MSEAISRAPGGLSLDPLLAEPPRKVFIRDDGELVYEHLVLVGWVGLDPHEKLKLESYGIETAYARWDPRSRRFECCLFSLELVGTLSTLKAAGDLDFDFHAELSHGGAKWVEALATGRKPGAEALSGFLQGEL